MKERGILFSAPMVNAILAGQKTQTRRIMKPQPANGCRWEMNGNGDKALHLATGPGGIVCVPYKATSADHRMLCPYGGPGDRLWVRETWYYFGGDEYIYQRDPSAVSYRADENWPPSEVAWRPSIFMPRWASRITLEITAVRVERLQDITDEDIAAEGVTPEVAREMSGMADHEITTLRWAWQVGWDAINGKRAPWSSNPWVWCVSFRRVQP